MSQIIWEAKLDDQYECKVTRIDGYTGRLTVDWGKEKILDEVVGLEYGAIFGPDVADVAYWQDKCVKAVDKINVDRHA